MHTKEEFRDKVTTIFLSVVQENLKEHLDENKMDIIRFMVQKGNIPPDTIQRRIEDYLGEKSENIFNQSHELTTKIISAWVDVHLVSQKIEWNILNSPDNTDGLELLLFKINTIKEALIQTRTQIVLDAHLKQFVEEVKKFFIAGNQEDSDQFPMMNNKTKLTFH